MVKRHKPVSATCWHAAPVVTNITHTDALVSEQLPSVLSQLKDCLASAVALLYIFGGGRGDPKSRSSSANRFNLGYIYQMAKTTPAQRTAVTAKILLTAGFVFASEALWRGSVARTLVAACLLVFGGGLLMAAKRAD